MSRPCPHCQRPYAPGRRFCGACRAVLAAICTTCSFVNDHDDAWCGGCARSLKAEQRWVPAQADPPSSSSRSIAIPEARPAPPSPPPAISTSRQTTRAIAVAPMPPARPAIPDHPGFANRPGVREIEVEIEPVAAPAKRSGRSDSIEKVLAAAHARAR